MELGGCGETRISDATQLQKWQYLQSTSHLGRTSGDATTELIDRAINADITAPSDYCSSLVDSGRRLGIDMRRQPVTPMPSALTTFINKAVTTTTRPVYTDSFFTVNDPLLASLTLPPAMLTRGYLLAAMGMYFPQHEGSPPLALLIRTPTASATDAYYLELLGTAILMKLAQAVPITAYSDCSSALTKRKPFWVQRSSICSMAPSSWASGT